MAFRIEKDNFVKIKLSFIILQYFSTYFWKKNFIKTIYVLYIYYIIKIHDLYNTIPGFSYNEKLNKYS